MAIEDVRPRTKVIKTIQRTASLPDVGFVRLPQVLAVFPVSRSTWWAGVKAGLYPKPVKLGPRVTAWRVEEVRALLSQARAIEDLARKELRGRLFFYVESERAKFWPMGEVPLFGKLVEASFPSAIFDIRSAGTCLATGHSTAAVFHLMRAMEAGLAVLGKRFRVSLEHTRGTNRVHR